MAFRPTRTFGLLIPLARRVAHSRGFLRLWVGETLSQLGWQIGYLALAVIAINDLAGTDSQIALLNVSAGFAMLLVGLPAGVWVDRTPHRRVLVMADLCRVLVFAMIPVLAGFGVLSVWALCGLAFVAGIGNVLFDTAYQSIVPSLVSDASQLNSANSRLESTARLAAVVGPLLGGVFLASASPYLVVAAAALGYATSAFLVSGIRVSQVQGELSSRDPFFREMLLGLVFVFRDRLLRRLAIHTGLANFFIAMVLPFTSLVVLRALGEGPAGAGVAFSAGAVGGLLGALVSTRVAKWVGGGRVLPLAALGSATFLLLLPLATTSSAGLWLVCVAQFGTNLFALIFNVAQRSIRQTLAPPSILGRVNATVRFVALVAVPVGGVGASLAMSYWGLTPILWIGAFGAIAASGLLVFSPFNATSWPTDGLPQETRHAHPTNTLTRLSEGSSLSKPNDDLGA